MKQLTFSFLCLLLGSVLVCTSFVMAAEPAAAEGIIQEETKGAQEAILAPLATSKPSATVLVLCGGNMMTLQKAEKRLKEEFEKAKKLGFVNNPIAYALYQVWKEADKSGGRKAKAGNIYDNPELLEGE